MHQIPSRKSLASWPKAGDCRTQSPDGGCLNTESPERLRGPPRELATKRLQCLALLILAHNRSM
jgi:hypothetical protein